MSTKTTSTPKEVVKEIYTLLSNIGEEREWTDEEQVIVSTIELAGLHMSDRETPIEPDSLQAENNRLREQIASAHRTILKLNNMVLAAAKKVFYSKKEYEDYIDSLNIKTPQEESDRLSGAMEVKANEYATQHQQNHPASYWLALKLAHMAGANEALSTSNPTGEAG